MLKENISICDDFREKLKNRRKEMGISIRVAAKLCGISPTYYKYLESGERSGISLRLAETILSRMDMELIIQSKS